MSIETEIKKLQAAVVQLTDAIVLMSERASAAQAGVAANTVKEAEPFPPSNTREDKFEEPVPTVDPPATPATTTAPAMPGTSAQSRTGPVPSTVVGKATQPAQTAQTTPTTQIPPISLADFGQKLGTIAVKMGDNGAGLRELTGKYGAMHISQIPEDKRNEFLVEASALAGGGA